MKRSATQTSQANAQRPIRTATPSTIRDINRSIVLNLIRTGSPISRVEISNRTGIGRSNVSDIVEELLRSNLVREERATPDGRGRVPFYLYLHDDAIHVIGINVRPTRTTVACAGFTGKIKVSESFATPKEPEELVAELARVIKTLRKQVLGPKQQFARAGVSLPGLVNSETGIVQWIPSLPHYSGFPLGQKLSKAVGFPAAVDNDCDLGALAEHWMAAEAGEPLHDFVFLEVGDVGVGAGIVLNGELYHGGDATSVAEFGHMGVDPNGPVCTCGKKGCWQLFVCDRATWQRYDSKSRFTPGKFDTLIEAVEKGDKQAIRALETTAEYLAYGISNMKFALNPSVIIIAGQITRAWSVVEAAVTKANQKASVKSVIRPTRYLSEELFMRGALTLTASAAFGRPNLG